MNNMAAKDNTCPACGSKEILKVWTRCRFDEKKEIRWCKKCGFGWQHPLPTPEEIGNYYKNFSTYNIHGEDEKERGFQKRIQQINEMLPERGKLLDVGAGLGYFLKIAIENGWEVAGVEPQDSAAKYCRDNLGINVQSGFLDDSQLRPKSFDVVTLWDVLEHVHEPLNFLKKCIEYLVPGGLLVMAIPNASGWPARVFKGKWRYVMYTHLNYFTMPYIHKTINTLNLDIIHTNHTIKIHSLLQGAVSWFPMDIDVERIIRLGRKNSPEKDRPEQLKSKFSFENSAVIKEILFGLRKTVHSINLSYLSAPVGDLVDIYCRKKIQ